jgi:hypothetical protein
MWQGTTLCAQCLSGEAGVLLHEDVDPDDQAEVNRARLQLMDGLRDGTRRNTAVAGF